MKCKQWVIWIMTPALIVAVLWGCYESADMALHEPGVYKGKNDPLVAKQRSPEQQQQLVERFKKIQTDR